MKNQLEYFSLREFGQMNNPNVTDLGGGAIRIGSARRTDMFRDPFGALSNDTAPFLYKEKEGDFCCTVCVEHSFATMYDAADILIWHDPGHFAKICFEGNEYAPRCIVSVVTNEISDDSNGVYLDTNRAWLRVERCGNIFKHFYSVDGESFMLVRRYHLALPKKVKVGMAVQSPIGEGTSAVFSFFSIT